ncbi:hypothetical protein [uncultured Fibrobacter sp.]|uniref:hypothetical protein n=1 Tax=uncultured Fibrobacter sp. TaxID=261512 RepID=UPI00280592EE|nr:hypothetical protein [uncultured Fibrobacter sp.]
MKLQDAYASETNALGKWVAIGYKAPGGTNFTYAGGDVSPATTCATGGTYDAVTGKCKNAEGTEVAATGSSITDGWTAANTIKLNDCPAQVNWKLSAAVGLAASDNGSVTYTQTIVDETNCGGLTPNFKAIGK